jgi:heme exporter protein C
MPLIDLAHPTRFLHLAERLLPWCYGASLLALPTLIYSAFIMAPPDYQQGETIRIMFLHVPSAWLAMACYTLMALSALGTLVWRHPLADVSARAAAPLGAAFTFLALVTGSLWGKPMWGTWWVWDARLTSVLILFLMYLGLIALWRAIEEPTQAARATAVMILIGFINIPIIKFSVDWWNTLHQPASVLRLDGPAIHSSILIPLLISAVCMTVIFITLHLMAMRNEILARKIHASALKRASQHSDKDKPSYAV